MKRNYIGVILVIFLTVLVVFYLGMMETGALLKLFHHGKDADFTLTNAGTFGDSAGALNALFGSLAFGGVVLTVYWQIMESSRQSEESHRSQFENVFFQMTGMLEQIVSGLKVIVNMGDMTDRLEDDDTPELMMDMKYLQLENVYRKSENQSDQSELITIEGRAVFKYIYQQAKNDGRTLKEIIKAQGISGYEGIIDRQLDHYFRYFYRILKYIDTSKLIDEEQKYQYAGILRGQLSHFELLLIYYNGLSCYGNERLKPLIERYSVLKNLRIDELANENELGGDIIGVEPSKVYKSSFNDPSQRKVKSRTGSLLKWNMVWAVLGAMLFNTLLSDFWYDVIVQDVFSKVPDGSFGITLLLFTAALIISKRSYYWGLQTDYPKATKFKDEIREYLKRSYVIPMLLFVALTILPFMFKYKDMAWQGYGIPYIAMIVVLMLVKPIVEVGVMAYKTVTLVETDI